MVDVRAAEPKEGLGKELWIVTRFGGPIALSQLVQYLIVLTDIVMMAWLNVLSMAAGLLINSVYVAIYLSTFGLLQGMMPMAARAAATGDDAAFSGVVRAGLTIALVAALVLAAAVFGFALLLEPLGYAVPFAQQGFAYATYILPGYALSVLLIGLRNILIALGRTQLFALITVASAVLNAGLNLILAFGALGGPELGLAGIGLSTTIVDLGLFGAFGLLVLLARRGRFAPVATPLAASVRGVMRIGVPTASIFFIESSMFSGTLFVVGRNDTAFLAVLGLIFQYETMAMMVPIGLSQATVRLVSVAAASGPAAAARLSTVIRATLLLVAIYIAGLALVQFGLRVNFPRLLIVGSPLDGALLRALDTTQVQAFAIILFHAFVIVIASILRGLEEVRSSLWIVLACYWGVGLGLAVALIEFGRRGAELSVNIVAFAMLLSLLSILLKLNSSLRQWRSDKRRNKDVLNRRIRCYGDGVGSGDSAFNAAQRLDIGLP